MRANQKTLFLILISIAMSVPGFSQLATRENSPYNRFGIGSMIDARQIGLRGMGGTATGYADLFSINSYNPASYAFLRYTTLDFGVEARSRSVLIQSADTAARSGTATFSYFQLAIPLKKYAGLSFGFQPISNTFYNQGDTVEIDGMGKNIRTFQGMGTLQYAFVGLAGKYKGLSLGANVGYAFGNIRKTSSIENIADTNLVGIRNSYFGTFDHVGGVYWKVGALYQIGMPKDQYVNIGATAAISQNLNISREQYAIAKTYSTVSGQIDSAVDTTVNLSTRGKLVMPAEYSFGIHYGKHLNYDVGADFVLSDWSSYRYLGQPDASVANQAWRFGVGGEITPNPVARKNYLSRATYRLGGYVGTDYVTLNGTQLNYWGATLGASFPFFKERLSTQYAKLNTSLDIGQRGTTANGLAREFFVKFSIGITFNDIWFIKPSFD